MLGKWKVEAQNIDDERVYSVFRLIDSQGADCPENREYSDYANNRKDADSMAKKLNRLQE